MMEQHSQTDSPVARHPVARGVWFVLGLFFVGLGIIGALLPIMPTTVFLILAVPCFTRSSPKLERWLLDHTHFGPPLRAWREQGAISRKGKLFACGGMAMGYGMFLFLIDPPLLPALLVGAVLAACAAWLATRPEPRTP